MVDPVTLRLWLGLLLYLGIAAFVVFVRLLPLDTTAGRVLAPDVLLCLTFAWLLRRPDHLPPLLIAAVFLTCDLLFLRPPGLWTLLVVVAAEFLRSREGLARELPFPLEWAMVAGVLVAATLAEAVILTVFLVPRADLGVALSHILITLLTYPFIVAALWLGLGLRRAATGEVDDLGRRL